MVINNFILQNKCEELKEKILKLYLKNEIDGDVPFFFLLFQNSSMSVVKKCPVCNSDALLRTQNLSPQKAAIPRFTNVRRGTSTE